MAGGLLQLVTSGKQDVYLTIDPEITFFKKIFRRHTNFSTELKQIFPEQQALFSEEVTFILNNIGDAVHRCYIQVDLPNISFSDSNVTNTTYLDTKSTELNRIQLDINRWSSLYTNLKNYVDIETVLYRKLKVLLDTENITISNLKDQVYRFNNEYKLQKELYKNKVEESVFVLIDISGYIIGINKLIGSIDSATFITVNTINTQIDSFYNSMVEYLKYYHINWQEAQDKYDLKSKTNNVSFNWANDLGHNYFEWFNLEIGGIEINKYYNDWLHISQKHRLRLDYVPNYNELIGNVPLLNSFNSDTKGNRKILIPLIFWFCKDAGSSLPLVSMQYQTVSINAKINELKKIVCFQNWEQMFNELLIYKQVYESHINSNLIYDKYYIDIDSKNITYNCLYMNDELLSLLFPSLSAGERTTILTDFGYFSSTYGENIMDTNNWIGFMNNIKNPSYSTIAPKVASYYPYIDYNILSSQVPLPNLSLIVESIFMDDVERGKFASSKLEYIVENTNDDIYDVVNVELFNCELSFTKPAKELYWYIQPKIFLEGLSEWGQNTSFIFEPSSYYANEIVQTQSILLNQLDILNDKNDNNYYWHMLPYKYLNSAQPKGVYYHTFSLYPEETQPSGTANLTQIKGKQFKLLLNRDFLAEYFDNTPNYLNPNENNLLLKFICKSYNLFIVEKGQGKLLFSI